MTARVVCVAGGIGSGKTEVSVALAARVGWLRASFGDYVRSVAHERGFADDREHLQQLGASLVEADLAGFCAAVLKHANWREGIPLVVDGLRHVEVLVTLRRLVHPLPVGLVYLSTSNDVRVERLASRPSDANRLETLDQHSTEIQVKSLDQVADLVLDGTLSVDTLVTSIAEQLVDRGPL